MKPWHCPLSNYISHTISAVICAIARRDPTAPELAQYQRLQQENQRLAENLGKLSSQLEAEIGGRRAKWLTRAELSNMDATVPVYKAAGRAFLLDDVPSAVAGLRGEIGRADQRILQLKKRGISTVGEQQEIAGQIRELVKPYLPK
jgi:chaperonin cofactor prefoldin